MQADGYGAYDGLHHVTNVGCLAHARRKFMDAKKVQGKGKLGKTDKALAKIQKLYGIESRLKGATVETRKAERQLHVRSSRKQSLVSMRLQTLTTSPCGFMDSVFQLAHLPLRYNI